MARPRLNVDIAMLLNMRDVEHLGWMRMAEKYRQLTGRFISRDSCKRKYFEAKAQQTKMAVKYRLISLPTAEKPQLIFERITPSSKTIEINGKNWVMVNKEPNYTIPVPTSPCSPDSK